MVEAPPNNKLAEIGVDEVTRIEITPHDTRDTLRGLLRASRGPVLLIQPWDVTMRALDYTVLARTAARRQLPVAWVIPDPEQRALARAAGFVTLSDESAPIPYAVPTLPLRPPRPRRPWWAETPEPRRRPALRTAWWAILGELLLLITCLGGLAAVLALTVPTARITLVPQSVTVSARVPVSLALDASVTQVDLEQRLVPTRRIGVEAEGSAAVSTSGISYADAGRATGQVYLVNLLDQEVTVPAGTVVRATAGSQPVRFQTLRALTLPAQGEAQVAIEALDAGPIGNVGPYQINQMEGPLAYAVHVFNETATKGGTREPVPVVTRADRQRAWDVASRVALEQAYLALQALLEGDEFLPRASLIVQAAPKVDYSHLVDEATPSLSLDLRLLVTGQAVRARDVQMVAYQALQQRLPPGYRLTDVSFTTSEMVEEDLGSGPLTFYVTAYGTAQADIAAETVWELVRGQPVQSARDLLVRRLPLVSAPEIQVSPPWFPNVPYLRARVQILLEKGP